MPYQIKHKNGRIVCYLDGKRVSRRRLLARYPDAFRDPDLLFRLSSLVGWRRLASDALAVHPSQIKEAMERDRKHGIHVDYDSRGRPVLTSRQQRAKMIRSLGLFDRDAGYGDPAPDGRMEPAKIEMFDGF